MVLVLTKLMFRHDLATTNKKVHPQTVKLLDAQSIKVASAPWCRCILVAAWLTYLEYVTLLSLWVSDQEHQVEQRFSHPLLFCGIHR